MGLKSMLKTYLLMLLAFLLLDMIWIGVFAGDFYRQALAGKLAEDVNWAAALVFYLAYIVGIIVFAVRPAVKSGSRREAAVLGGLFGLFTYGTYAVSNLALMESWPWLVTVVDMAWGTGVVALLSLGAFAFANRIPKQD